MEGLLQPTYKEILQGQAVVQALFSVPKVGTVAGCRVTNGKITRNSLIRVLRDKQEEFKGNVASLRRVKDDVREVLAGYECGIKLENFDDIHVDDIIEAYTLEKITMTLEQAAARKIND
jgi:translation initiation factor IF-2